MIHYIVAIAAINKIDLNDTILRKDRTASLAETMEYNNKQFLELFSVTPNQFISSIQSAPLCELVLINSKYLRPYLTFIKEHKSVYSAAFRNPVCMQAERQLAVMVTGGRSYTYGLIPAIALAAYTTHRITMSIIHYRRSRHNANVFVAELRTINMIDSLVAVLTLQNTLIVANGEMSDGMQTLSAWTSAGVLVIIIVITVRSLLRIRKAVM